MWRPLQLWVIVRSARRFLRGDGEQWRKVRRYGSVDRSGLPADRTEDEVAAAGPATIAEHALG